MAKQPNWTNEEINKLKELLDEHIAYEEISKILNRSMIAIKIAMYKKLHYIPLCLDCGIKIKERKGNRLRCKICSNKHTIKRKKEYAQENKRYFNILKNENRFGGNRQLTLERDNFTCQICKKTHHEIILDVHHKDKSGRNKKLHNHSLDNLITLCHSCHTKNHKEDTIMKRWRK